MSAFLRGYRSVSPAERGALGLLSAFAPTVAVARGINYVRERRRPAPRLRSWARRAYSAPGQDQVRVHHFVPGMGLAFAAGCAAILSRSDGREFWLSLPFGAGVGLTLDEIALLVDRDNPYWASERAALAQSAAAGLAATALAAHMVRLGRDP
jgi:hypothetical protein